MKHPVCILALLCLYCSAFSTKAEPLKVGDSMPDLELHQMLNYKSESLLLNTYKEDLLILQFITTTCGTCIKSVDSLQSLSERTAVPIILISHNSSERTEAMIEKRNWKLPVSLDDSLLTEFFPHKVVPHQIWLKKGKVIAITDWRYATAANIKRGREGAFVPVPLKQEIDIDLDVPLVYSTPPLYHSAILPHVDNGSAGIRFKNNTMLVFNSTIYQLYKDAFRLPLFPSEGWIVLEVSDSISRLIKGPEKGITGDYEEDKSYYHWQDNYLFCYNQVYHPSVKVDPTKFYRNMRLDLNNFFSQYMNISGKMEKREVHVLALVTKGKHSQQLHTAGGQGVAKSDPEYYRQQNMPLSSFTFYLAATHPDMGMPVVDRTGITDNVDLDIPGGLSDLVNVTARLKEYGLTLEPQKVPLEVLVISSNY